LRLPTSQPIARCASKSWALAIRKSVIAMHIDDMPTPTRMNR
jgi:hypothetical protein